MHNTADAEEDEGDGLFARGTVDGGRGGCRGRGDGLFAGGTVDGGRGGCRGRGDGSR